MNGHLCIVHDTLETILTVWSHMSAAEATSSMIATSVFNDPTFATLWNKRQKMGICRNLTITKDVSPEKETNAFHKERAAVFGVAADIFNNANKIATLSIETAGTSALQDTWRGKGKRSCSNWCHARRKAGTLCPGVQRSLQFPMDSAPSLLALQMSPATSNAAAHSLWKGLILFLVTRR